MSRASDKRAAAEKAAALARIRAAYPELVRQYKAELCATCRSRLYRRLYRQFDCGLEPVTSDGEPCPYYEKGG
jgi:hypothetical protein